MKVIFTDKQLFQIKKKFLKENYDKELLEEINFIKNFLKSYTKYSSENTTEKLYYVETIINEINFKLNIKNQILEFKKNDLPLNESKVENKIDKSFKEITKKIISFDSIFEQNEEAPPTFSKQPDDDAPPAFQSPQQNQTDKKEEKESSNKFLNWIKKFKWGAFFEGLRKVLQSTAGQAVQKFLSSTGIGAIGVTAAWGVLTLYDLWNLIKGKGNWFLLIIDVVSIASGGWVGNKLTALKGMVAKNVDEVAKTISKNKTISNLIKPLLKKISSLDSWLKNISAWAQKKLKASWLSEANSQTNSITGDLATKIEEEIKKEETGTTGSTPTTATTATTATTNTDQPPTFQTPQQQGTQTQQQSSDSEAPPTFQTPQQQGTQTQQQSGEKINTTYDKNYDYMLKDNKYYFKGKGNLAKSYPNWVEAKGSAYESIKNKVNFN